MAEWVTPVTNRTNGSARMTYEDMNRITGNLAYLYDLCRSEGIAITGSRYSKTSWSRNDIITVSEWTELLGCLANAKTAVGYTQTAPTRSLTYTNINTIERQTQAVYNIINSYDMLPNMNHWVGDLYYAGDSLNAGGRYD